MHRLQARRLGLAGAAAELGAGHRLEHNLGVVSETYRGGRAGTLLRAGKALTAVGAGLSLLGKRSRVWPPRKVPHTNR